MFAERPCEETRPGFTKETLMDAIRLIAEQRIEDAMADGLFDGLPPRGYIDCSLGDERFFAEWFAKKLEREERAP